MDEVVVAAPHHLLQLILLVYVCIQTRHCGQSTVGGRRRGDGEGSLVRSRPQERRWRGEVGQWGKARDTDAQLCGGARPIVAHWVLTFKIALFSSDVDRVRSSGILLVARRSEALIMVTAMPVQKRSWVNQQHTVLLYPTERRVSLHLARDVPYGSNICVR